MLAARARGGRRSGALVASRCAANKRALSATRQARLLEQCELARWELGPVNGLNENSDRPAVAFWARVKPLSRMTMSWVAVDPHDFFGALDASTRGLWSVYDSSGLLARAGLLK